MGMLLKTIQTKIKNNEFNTEEQQTELKNTLTTEIHKSFNKNIRTCKAFLKTCYSDLNDPSLYIDGALNQKYSSFVKDSRQIILSSLKHCYRILDQEIDQKNQVRDPSENSDVMTEKDLGNFLKTSNHLLKSLCSTLELRLDNDPIELIYNHVKQSAQLENALERVKIRNSHSSDHTDTEGYSRSSDSPRNNSSFYSRKASSWTDEDRSHSPKNKN